MANLIEKYKEILNPFKKKLGDNPIVKGNTGVNRSQGLANIKRDARIVGKVGQGIAKDLSYGLKPKTLLSNINLAKKTPTEFARGVDLSIGYSPIGKTAMKFSEGAGEGATWGALDIPVNKSTNLPEKLAYGLGYTSGMVISPLTKLASAGAVGMTKIPKVGKVLSQADKMILAGGKNKYLGTGIKNVAEGLSYTGVGMGAKALMGGGYDKNEILANTLIDTVIGVSPLGKYFVNTPASELGSVKKVIKNSAEADEIKVYIKRLLDYSQELERKGDKRLSKQVFNQAKKAYKEFRKVGGKGSPLGVQEGGEMLSKVDTPKKPVEVYKEMLGDKKVEQTFRTEKFNLSNKDQKNLKELLSKMGLDTRTVRSFKEMESVAQDLLGDPVKVLRDIETGRIKDSEVVALGNIINTSTTRIAKLHKRLKADPTNLKLQQALSQEEAVLQQAIKKRVKGGTEAGRTVASFRILANKTMDPAYWVSKAQKQLGDSRKIRPEEIDTIRGFIKQGDRLGLAKYVGMMGESTFGEKAFTVWKAGLLTNPATHVANMTANTAFGVLEGLKDIPATGFDIARSTITRTPRAKSLGVKTLSESVKSIGSGTKQAAQYLKEGVDPRELNKFENLRNIRYGESKGGRLAQTYVDGVFRLLGAEDKVFREVAFNRSIADQAMTMSLNKRMTAGELDNLIKNPTSEMVEQAIKDGQVATFNNPNAISKAISQAKQGNKAVAGVLDFVFPFVRTPTNVLLRAIDYTPVGIAKTATGSVTRKIINGTPVNNRELADAFGRSSFGLAVLGAGYALAAAGRLQGASPSSEAERSQMYLEGRQPNSILINDKWVKIDKISPVSSLLVMGGSFYDAEGNVLEKTTQAGLVGTKALSEQSFLKGGYSAIKAVMEADKGGPSDYLESAIGGIVPNVVKATARGTDDVMRDKDTLTDAVVSGIPGLNQSLPVRVDAMGNAIPNPDLATSLFSPFNPKEATKDPLILEFKRVGYNLSPVSDKIAGVKLIPEQERALQRLTGAKIREYLVPVINSSAYQSAGVDAQRDLIDKAVIKAKAMAREEIKPQLSSITKGSDRGFTASAGYEKSDDSPENKIGLYVESGFKDPLKTVGAITSGQPIRKTRGNVVVLEREKNLSKLDQGNKDTQVDHIVPLSLGGSNKQSNLQILTATENNQKAQVENYLIKKYENKEISKKEAVKRVKNWRSEYENLPNKKVIKDTATVVSSISYVDETDGKIKTVDVSKYTQPNPETGIEKYKWEKDKLTAGYKVYSADIPDTDKKGLLDKMGLKYEDLEYGYFAKQTNDVKYQYIAEVSKTMTRNEFLKSLVQGRKESISGQKLVADGVLERLVDGGFITSAEAKQLKKMQYTSTGKKKSTKSTKAKKLKKVELVKPKLGSTSYPKSTRRSASYRGKYDTNYINKALGVDTSRLLAGLPLN